MIFLRNSINQSHSNSINQYSTHSANLYINTSQALKTRVVTKITHKSTLFNTKLISLGCYNQKKKKKIVTGDPVTV